MPKINFPLNIKTPDFLFNGVDYDLKIVHGKSKQLLYHNIYNKKGQVNNFIFDISKSPLKIEQVIA